MPDPSASFPAICRLHVVLRGVSPLVWRRLLVASDTSLAELHEVLQHAFGWSDDHLHRFLIHGTAYGVPRLGGISFQLFSRQDAPLPFVTGSRVSLRLLGASPKVDKNPRSLTRDR